MGNGIKPKQTQMQKLWPICKCCFWGCLFLCILRARWRMPVYCCLGYLIPSLSLKCNSFFFLMGFANDLKWTEELPLWFLCISSQITTHSRCCCQNHQVFLCRAVAQKNQVPACMGTKLFQVEGLCWTRECAWPVPLSSHPIPSWLPVFCLHYSKSGISLK